MKRLIAAVIAAVIPLALAVAEDQPNNKIKKQSEGTKAKPSDSVSIPYEKINYPTTAPASKKTRAKTKSTAKPQDLKARPIPQAGGVRGGITKFGSKRL